MATQLIIDAGVQNAVFDNKTEPRELAERLGALIAGMAGGSYPGTISVIPTATLVAASGTATLTNVIATDAMAIAGVTFTAVASGATSVQFNVGANDTETAANLAAAINANTTSNKYVTATSALTVVTITAKQPGLVGNLITLTSADTTIVVTGSGFLASGAGSPTAAVYSY